VDYSTYSGVAGFQLLHLFFITASTNQKLNGRIFASKKLKKYFCLRSWRVLTLSIPTYESLNITSIKALFLSQHLITRFGALTFAPVKE
jgi:hypothetical protein